MALMREEDLRALGPVEIELGPREVLAAGTEPVAVAVRSPGRPRDMALRQRLLDATLVELAQVGFRRASVEGIAARAGAGKATVYRHWSGLPDIVRDALTEQELAPESRELLALIERERRASGMRRLVAECASALVGDE